MLNRKIFVHKQLLNCSKHSQTTDFFNTDPDYSNGVDSNRLMCYQCLQQYSRQLNKTSDAKSDPQIINIYSSEDIVCTKIYLSQICQKSSNNNTSCLTVSAQIQTQMLKIQKFIVANEIEFDNYFQVLAAWEQQAQKIRKKALNVLQLSNSFQKIISSCSNQPNLLQNLFSQFIMSHNEYFSVKKEELIDNEANTPIYRYFQSLKKQLNSIQQSLQKLQKTSKVNNYNVLVLFQLDSSSEKLNFRFTQDLFGDCMTLVDPLTITMNTASSQRIAMMQPCLSKSSKKKSWKIQILKLASWVGLGVCHYNKIKDANFHFNYSQTFHGSYFISSNGYSWSSYKPEFNSKTGSFSFVTGDIIKLQYSPKDGIIKFYKQGSDLTYEIQVEKNDDKIYPAVNLTGVNDSVKIIK